MVEPSNQNQINETEWLNRANWKAGLFYYSQKDTRIWVPKLSMFGRRRYGGTPNFAQRGARIYLAILLGFMFLMFLVVLALERAGQLK